MMTNTVMITTNMMTMMSQVWTSLILPDFSESLLKTLQIITTISLNPTGSPSPNPLISPTEEFTTNPSAISSPSPSLNPSTSTSLSQSTHSSLNQLTPTSPSVTIQPAITSNSKHLSYLFRNVFFVVQLNAQGCLNKIKET